jgi:hypothetical protein
VDYRCLLSENLTHQKEEPIHETNDSPSQLVDTELDPLFTRITTFF